MQFRALGLLLCVLAWAPAARIAAAQADSATAQLLGRAHALELRGRMDMARQYWSQVLLVDPNNTEALAGMARAAKSEGHLDESNQYLAKLRAINPNDPNITRVQQMGTAQDPTILLRQAARLSAQGKYTEAMAMLRQVYGNEPPPGDAALSYYQTEAAIDAERPQAIAALRALADKFPDDPRYNIALGTILTFNPRTRAEGRKLLAKYPNDPQAVAALRQSLVWDEQNPSMAGAIREFETQHPGDQQLAAVLQQDEAAQRAAGPVLTPGQRAAQRERAVEGRELQSAYASLNARRYSEAEQRFDAILRDRPNDAKALAGLGYVRMNQANFAGAISYFSEAEQNGARDAALEHALADSRFYYTMRAATGALNENDLQTAIQQFRAALNMRPTDATAMEGLGGTLLKAGQADAALALYTSFVHAHPADSDAWRGEFMAYAAAEQYDQALGVDRRMPHTIHEQLMHNPDYLSSLASVYAATGREGDAQRTLTMALNLPFPANGAGLRAETELQYAGLLEAAGRHEQAAGLYRQVLTVDANNIDALVGLVDAEHSLGRDTDAYNQLRAMAPATYQQAMQQPGFATTVAAIYMSQGHEELAKTVLQEFLSSQQASHQRAFVPAQVTLANIYLREGDTAHAFPLFETILTNNPDRPDAWKGLLNSLHATGHDREALAEIQQMPPAMRRQLEADPDYLQTVGSIYAALGHPEDAMRFLGRAQQHFRAQGVAAPSDIDIQTAWLLFNTGSDTALYRQLMVLGDRTDLSDEQRRTVQTIWASFAVRRSQQAIQAGNPRRAIAILNAAAQAFPNNPAVLKALGSGYAAAGLPKEAVEIFRAQDLAHGTAADYRAAVGAAMADNDLKDAEVWLRFGLGQYPQDADLLGLAAKFEQARGDPTRAAEYYRASLHAMPGPDPGAELAEELSHAPVPTRLPSQAQPQDLASLLAEPSATATAAVPRPYLPGYGNEAGEAPVVLNRRAPASSQSSTAAPNAVYAQPAGVDDYPAVANPATITPGSTATSGMSGIPGADYANPPSTNARKQGHGSTLGDYIPPQSKLELPALPGGGREALHPVSFIPRTTAATHVLRTHAPRRGVLHLHADPAIEARFGPYVPFIPGEPVQQPSVLARAKNVLSVSAAMRSGAPAARVSYLPVSRAGSLRLSVAAFHPAAQSGASVPVVEYVPLARPARKPARRRSAHPRPAPATQPAEQNPFADFGDAPVTPEPSHRLGASAAQHAARSTSVHPIHLGTASRTTQEAAHGAFVPAYVPPPIFIPGESTPTAAASTRRPSQPIAPDHRITYPSRATETAAQRREAAAARAAAIRANQANSPLVLEGTSHPPVENYDTETNSDARMNSAQFSPAQQQGSQVPQAQPPARTGLAGLFGGSQTQSSTTSSSLDGQGSSGQQYPQPSSISGEHIPHHRRSSSASTTTTTTTTTTTPPPQPGMSYPTYGQPLQNEGPPTQRPEYPLPPPPSDDQLQQLNLPPLRGYFDPRVSENPRVALTPRQQTQLDLALIEGSYSNWLGGSAIGAYRSGTPGIDRMESLTAPFEASVAFGNAVRFSIVPEAVFLNSGQYAPPLTPKGIPILGTLYDSGTAPSPQYAAGIGGSLQMTTATIAASLGYTPYGFLVSNLIGDARWRPGNWHFTFFGGRDPVKETMLSYAGLRDPGTATASTPGSIWGGVVQSGGGVRFDEGNAQAGLYAQLEGYEVTGYHVLDNRKFDGTMGAYFRVHTWPHIGALNIGGTLFGEHFTYNELGETYGLGGYFSPNAYFLAAMPITFNGHYLENLHYTINGSVGIQTFQSNSEIFFPLDPASQAGVCSAATTTPCQTATPASSTTGLNYSVDSELSYHITDHWYIGAFLSGNNTNNYNTISGGAFARYMFRPQAQTEDYPTGLFPVEGPRSLRVP